MPLELYDAYGKPIKRARVAQASDSANLFDKNKERWTQAVAPGLTPERLGRILRTADQGNNLELLTLGLEMEERDNGLFTDLQTRKLAIAGAPLHVEPWDDTSKRGKHLAEVCQYEVVNQPCFRFLLHQIMGGILPGYSVQQVIWNTETTPWTFASFEDVDARHFQFDLEDIRSLRLRDEFDPDGREIPQNFLIHWPRLRSGHKMRGGLIRLCAVSELAKTSTVMDWLAFAEVYGMPLRIGRYNPNVATQDEIDTLRSALVNLGHDAAAIIPESMQIEFADARLPPSGDNIYRGLAEYFDGQRTRAILGTAPSSEGSSAGQGQAVAEARREVRSDIRQWDALCVSSTIQCLFDQWIAFNYGPAAPRIKLRIDVEPSTDVQAFTAAVLPWVREAGLEVPMAWLRRQLQIPEPKSGEEMLTPPMLPGAEPGGGGSTRGLDGAKRGAPSPASTPKV
jgi:phage gp29-like protein